MPIGQMALDVTRVLLRSRYLRAGCCERCLLTVSAWLLPFKLSLRGSSHACPICRTLLLVASVACCAMHAVRCVPGSASADLQRVIVSIGLYGLQCSALPCLLDPAVALPGAVVHLGLVC